MEFVGRRVRKDFKGFGIFTGVVKSYNPSSGFFKIGYEDGDSEEIESSELASCLEEDGGGVGDDHSHSQPARKKPSRVGRKPKKRRKVLGSSNSGNNNDSSACLVALVTSDNSNLESVGERDLRDVVVSFENLSKNAGFNVGDNNVSSVCENANLHVGGLDLNRRLDDLNETVKGNDDGIDLNLDLNEEGNTWELKQKGSGNFGVKKEHCFDLNMGLDDDESRDEDVDLGGYSKGNNGESKRRENCGEVESTPVEGASSDKHLFEVSEGPDPDGNILVNGGMDTGNFGALSTNFVTNGDSSEDQKQDVSVAAASPVHDQQVTTGSAHTGRRRGRKRKKLSDSVNSPAESVLRRSTRRRAKFSAEDHVPKTVRYDGENSTLLSPAVSAVSEEQPTISGYEESEEPSILPSKFELPPSSGHVNLNGIPALDLFSVFAFLRSFSTLLFLSPFELGDFVASLRSKSPNLLIDHIHVSLLQTLRKQLESQSGESSPSATNCLRDLNWDMLDLITWPIFMVEYLLMKPGFDLCHLKLFKSDYYKQPEFVKIEILQCLCDDVIEVEAIRSELNRRTLVGEPTTIVDSDRSTRFVSSRRRRGVMDVSGGCTGEEFIDETADWNSDECCLCKMDGNLICCDGCPAAFHSKCVGVVTSLLPEGDWFCPECALDRENPGTSSAQSIRGAELLGVDPQGHLYYSSCRYLLVLDPCNGESSFHYYHMNDLTAVVEALKLLNGPYRTIASVITKLSDVYKKVNGESMDSENAPLCLESPVKGQLPATSVAPVPWESSETCAKDKTVTEERPVEPCMPSTYSSNLKHDVSGLVTVSSLTANPEKIERLLAPEGSFEIDCSNNPAGVSGKPTFAGHLSLKSSSFNVEQGKNVESSNCVCDLPKISTMKGLPEELVTNYVNLYSFARVASSVAGEWTRKSSDKLSSEPTKSLEELISAQMKAISKTSAEFCWSNIQNLKVNARNEKCGWCLYCKYPTDDGDCLFNSSNNASVLEGFTGDLLGFGSRKDGEGRLVDVMCHILCIENRLHGLLVGPWLNPHFPKLYHKSFLEASDIVPVKNLLLMLESNIRALAFSAEWLKHVDLVNTVGSASHIVTSNRVPSRNVIGRKRCRGLDLEPRSSRNASSGLGLFWWRGGKLTRHLFNCKVLPRSLASKAARQGGGKKIQGILYPDNSDFAKRSRPLAWRASVESSVTVEQLALQVRELDANIRWDHIESTSHLLMMDKEYMKLMRLFKKAIIRRKCSEGDTVKYLLDFGKRRFIPDTVVKHGSKLEESSSERKKYWLEEPYVPLFMLKAFEERKIALKSNKMSSGNLPVSRRVMKKPFKEEGFSYLYSRAERSENYQCGHCNKDVLIRDAVSCQFCESFFHKRHVRKTSGAITADCAYTCHKCHGGNGNYAKIDIKKGNYSKKTKKASKVLKPVQSKITRKNGKGKQPVQRHKPQTRARAVVVVPLRRSARRAKIVALQSKKTEVRKKKQRKSANKTKQQKPVDQMNQPKGKRGRPRKHPRKDILQKRRTQLHSTYWLNGLLLSRKPDDDRVMHFRTKNHLVHFERLAAISDQPKCSLCCEAEFRPLLNYICCETCGDWFHGDAFGLQDEHIQIVIGFKCHKCRNRAPPICPHLQIISDKSNLDDLKNDEVVHGTDEISNGMGLADEALEKQKPVAAVEPKDLFLVDDSTQKEPHVEPVLGLLGDPGADAQNGPVSAAMDSSTGATNNSEMKNLGPADTLIEPSENSSSNDILLASMAESTMSEYTKDASEKESSLTHNLVNDGSFRTKEATETQSSDVNRTLVGSSEMLQREATVDSGELDREF